MILNYIGLYCDSSWGLGWGHIYVSEGSSQPDNLIDFPDHCDHVHIRHYRHVLPDTTLCTGGQRAVRAQAFVEVVFGKGSR